MKNVPPIAIPPVPDGASRPLWSVMIPTFNCAAFLPRTLASVLEQDPGPEVMQIEVIDDVSTNDDPAVVTADVGRGRIDFHRKPRNEGATANFNTCLERARGHLVHILHGDDYVCQGFYQRVSKTFEASPNIALVATRSFVVDRDGSLDSLSGRYPSLERATRNAGMLFDFDELHTPGIVVRRTSYERYGGFRPDLVHTADWEMLLRLFTHAGGIVLNEPLACYRKYGANDTSRLAKTAENLRDFLRFGEYASVLSPSFSTASWRKRVARLAAEQSYRFRFGTEPDVAAAQANTQLWRELTPMHIRWLERIAEILNDRARRWWS